MSDSVLDPGKTVTTMDPNNTNLRGEGLHCGHGDLLGPLGLFVQGLLAFIAFTSLISKLIIFVSKTYVTIFCTFKLKANVTKVMFTLYYLYNTVKPKSFLGMIQFLPPYKIFFQ